MTRLHTLLALIVTMVLVTAPRPALAHCDSMDGPVVQAAQAALEGGNVNLVLIWVRPQDEGAVRSAFAEARAALTPDKKSASSCCSSSRTGSGGSQFLETVVRLHRAGEGEPYTGLKPAGHIPPALAAADRSVEAGNIEPLRPLFPHGVPADVSGSLSSVIRLKGYAVDDVAAGRSFVQAYVRFMHHVEHATSAEHE